MEKLRKQLLEAKLQNAPEKLKNTFLKQFERMSFKDEDDFDAYIKEVDKDLADLNQDLSNSGPKGFGKPKTAGGGMSAPSREETKRIVDDLMR